MRTFAGQGREDEKRPRLFENAQRNMILLSRRRADMMKRFVEGLDRGEGILFPERLVQDGSLLFDLCPQKLDA